MTKQNVLRDIVHGDQYLQNWEGLLGSKETALRFIDGQEATDALWRSLSGFPGFFVLEEVEN